MSDVETEAQAEPVNTSLRDQLTAAFEKQASEPADEGAVEATTQEVPGHDAERDAASQEARTTGERERDESGRFVKADSKPADATPAEAPKEAAPTEAAPEAPAADVPAPESVSGAVKEHWKDLPADVRKALVEREEQVSKGFKEYREKTKAWSEVDKLMEPLRPALIADGKTPAAYIGELVQLSTVANQDPERFAKWFVEARGLDPAKLFGTAPQQAQQAQAGDADLSALADDPMLAPVLQKISALEARNQELEQKLGGVVQQGQMASRSQFESAISRFMSDAETYPFAQALENDIAEFVAAARSKGQTPNQIVASLPEFYERAKWANPDVRQHLLADQKAEEDRQRTQEAERRAQQEAERKRRAQAAGGSISGAPTGATGPSSAPPDSLRALLEQKVHEAISGGARV